ncbi:MAG: ribosome assembly RNA-binding protein YhbY [Caldibacillus debilis]|jgi:RNA-binding protein|uniref:CRM domain-containing protein n=1 Tax=Caldibacillus debilis TaxID=301148 RepID=A0A150LFX9_9BACI|nr:ribosome assembly RNA-binding protein YhbY [Caldibacillus debilis]MBO2480914.1 ribosome assembly RNA-binding protein YhbY [Bacillaceae bacterium]KYD11140.1 hypothetical protein B4135_3255 [Caldibacillus debilis]MBY6270595.1 ribosome assembly RNA-binding protein YhbY [Bacillaceae bacterium]OUM84794.1 MAG: RNA-binding protein [Caldibacillus debilis]REJ13841.1 MAG: ribosome assembly RNA-binding protein YhbY [Caldibacillus debilis]
MLTGKQKRFLRAKAHHLQPIFQVGKGGVNDNLVAQVMDALEARELIKIHVLNNCPQPADSVASELAEKTGAELVQTIGKTIVLYKESKENKQIDLP